MLPAILRPINQRTREFTSASPPASAAPHEALRRWSSDAAPRDGGPEIRHRRKTGQRRRRRLAGRV